MRTLPLEDQFEDILAKAMRGLTLGESELAARTGVPVETVRRLARGELCDEAALGRLATALNLHPRTLLLSATRSWQPMPVHLPGLHQVNTAYRDMQVNAYIVHLPGQPEAVCFDTGTDADALVEVLRKHSLKLAALFITHTHNDHIAALDRLRSLTGHPPAHARDAEPWPDTQLFSAGQSFTIAGLRIATRATTGHSRGGTSYVVEGLDRPLAVVGDALFAGSMGGGMVSYADALRTNREELLTLPPETVICPGHGPLSTIGQERRFNPFFPETKEG